MAYTALATAKFSFSMRGFFVEIYRLGVSSIVYVFIHIKQNRLEIIGFQKNVTFNSRQTALSAGKRRQIHCCDGGLHRFRRLFVSAAFQHIHKNGTY